MRIFLTPDSTLEEFDKLKEWATELGSEPWNSLASGGCYSLGIRKANKIPLEKVFRSGGVLLLEIPGILYPASICVEKNEQKYFPSLFQTKS